MPPSRTALSRRPASSSAISGPLGRPRSSMAPYPRMLTSAWVRPSGRVMIAMRLTLPRAARLGLAGCYDHPDERVAVVPAALGVLRRRQPVLVGVSLEYPRLDR